MAKKSLFDRAKGWVRKKKKQAQKAAKQAYKKKVETDRKNEKHHVASSNYDNVRNKANNVSKPSGRTGGSSSGSNNKSSGSTNKSSWSSNRSGGTTQHRTGQTQSSAPAKKSGQSGWQAYVAKTFKTSKSDLQQAYEKGRQINALGTKVKTRTGGGVKSEDLRSEDYLKYQNASRNRNLKLDDKTAYKVGSRTAYAANRNSMARASHGFMQGIAMGDVESGPEKYNKQARQALKESRESLAGNIGYGAGQAAGFALGGTNSAAKSLLSGGAKAGAKAAAKTGAKTTAKKFIRNRAVEMAVETPMNLADAAKMAKDENGKINTKKFAKYAGLNTAMTGGMGAITEGAAIKFTKKNANQLIKLQAKANRGNLSKEEGQQLKRLYDKLNNVRSDSVRADSNIADRGYKEGRNLLGEGRTQKRLANASTPEKLEDRRIIRQTASDKLETKAGKRAIESQNARTTQLETEKARITEEAQNIIAKLDGKKPRNAKQKQAAQNRQQRLQQLEERIEAIDNELDVPGTVRKAERDLRKEQVYHLPNAIEKYGADSKQVKAIREKIDVLKKNVDDIRTREAEAPKPQMVEPEERINLTPEETETIQNRLRELREGRNEQQRELNYAESLGSEQELAETRVAINQTDNEIADLQGQLLGRPPKSDEPAERLTTGFPESNAKPTESAEAPKLENPKTQPETPKNPEAAKVIDGSKKHKEYIEKPRANQIKEERPSFKAFKESVDKGEMSGYETSKHLETIYEAGHFEPKEIKAQLEQDLKSGAYVKVNRESHADAIARAEKSVEDDWKKAFDRQISKSEAEDLTAFDYAERKYVMEKLESMVRNGEGDVDELVKMHRDLSINEVLTASNTGAALNAAKIMKRMTPAGRAQLMLKKVEKLNTKFGDRLKGETLELSEEQYNRILKAETEEEAAKVLDEISNELMEKIPSTVFEKLNEIRRFTMLANIRTHERNIIGNSVFAGARYLSDAMEVAAYKIPGVRNRVEKLGGVTEMNKLSYRKMVKENKEFLEDQFKKIYEASGSETQYKDALQAGQPKAFKNKAINKILDANYDALEKEDMLMFKPAFKKAYAQWCDSRGIKDLAKMTEQQKEQAGRFALNKAEYATFRDDSAFARKITGYKTKTAGKKGKTVLGTAGYRAANMAMEGHLPFVKTPVNILRRSVDYSPLGIVKGVTKVATAESAEMFKQGIHEVCSGLTGTGVAMFGALLASQGAITVQAGNVSGDAYYDRDMGYQDYSLVVGPEGHKYSVSIDWASPMQTSLFMGAAMQEKLGEEGFDMQDIMDIGVKVFNPMLDMSFLSTSKDTFDSFMDKVYRNGTGDDADWTGAITQTLFGKVPQGYLGSLVPQMVSQAATGSDKYQRDVRSTKENAVSASWESWGRQMANKFPVLRQQINNPKVDRFGNDKTNTGGNNIVMRFVNSMLNPSNMKRITTNKTDKELISIFNKIPEGTTEKKYFFYDFTGNPDYELSNGKRMTYNELYKYGKTKRQSTSDSIQGMFDADSYKNMTNDMKVDEIVKYKKDISTIQADMKVYGAKYTVERIVGGKNVSEKERKGAKADTTAWKIWKDNKGNTKESQKAFVYFWIGKENLIARSHETGYEVKALACALYGSKELGRAYDINTDKLDRAYSYIKEKGKKTGFGMFSDACCNIAAGLDKAQVESTSRPNRSWSAAGYDNIDESTYRAMGFDWNSAQSGAGLRQKYGYDVNQLIKMASDAKYEFDADKNGSLKKAEVMAYIDSLGLDDDQHKACLFEYLNPGGKNPYDSIDDYLKWGEDSRDEEGYGGRRRGRRGRRGRRRGRGGGGGGGGGGSVAGADWNTFAGSIFASEAPKASKAKAARSSTARSGGSSVRTTSPKKIKVKNHASKSALNDAYFRRAQRKQLITKK